MKSKKLLKLIMIISVFMITGCANNRTSEKKDETTNELFNNLHKVNLNCSAIAKVADINEYQNLFITEDGYLYQISYDKIFSNGTNCKQIESDKKFTRFIKAGILDSNNDIYYYTNDDVLELYDPSIGSIIMPNMMIEKIPKDLYSNIIYSDEDQKYGDNQIYYFYYDSSKKNVYGYSSDLSQMNNEPIFSLEKDEDVEYLTYGGIKTNKNYYQYSRKEINKEECEKYADIKCEMKNGFYEIDNEDIKKHWDQIKFISFSDYYFIVDKKSNFYTNVMGG